jgi:hypothetical protein
MISYYRPNCCCLSGWMHEMATRGFSLLSTKQTPPPTYIVGQEPGAIVVLLESLCTYKMRNATPAVSPRADPPQTPIRRGNADTPMLTVAFMRKREQRRERPHTCFSTSPPIASPLSPIFVLSLE